MFYLFLNHYYHFIFILSTDRLIRSRASGQRVTHIKQNIKHHGKCSLWHIGIKRQISKKISFYCRKYYRNRIPLIPLKYIYFFYFNPLFFHKHYNISSLLFMEIVFVFFHFRWKSKINLLPLEFVNFKKSFFVSICLLKSY